MKREEWMHHEWLSLLEISGPFLTVEVLKERFPQGLDPVPTQLRNHLRIAYDEWEEARYGDDPQMEALHRAWIEMVLKEALEYEESEIVRPEADEWVYRPLEHEGEIRADYALKRQEDEKPEFLVVVRPPGSDLDAVPDDGWAATVLERTVAFCRDRDVRFAIVTNGDRWTLVNAPRGSVSSTVTWYARIWFQEPVTLRAFTTLLGVRRLYDTEERRLGALLDESLQKQEEVTHTLGDQVRRAVEVLIQSLDRADRDRNRELLRGVDPKSLYEAGLTVMMRLVFLLSAEERGLLLSGDPVYDENYAVSGLRVALAEEADRHGPETLERRHDAWSRLLALFRAVYGGVEHESLRMPALGGSLFDPDRFPFLEGRAPGSDWRADLAEPLPIDNRTVLLLLRALQILERPGGALRLSYKGLDVEQIGHVYEGLLEYTVRRVPTVTLGLKGSAKAKNPTIALDELETLREKGVAETAKALKELTERSLPALKKDLEKEVDEELFGKILLACEGDTELAARVRPFAHLLAWDAWGETSIYPADSYAVVPGSDRAATGAHYTPKSLTESVVATTLEPILYEGPAEGKPKEEWRLLPAERIVSLKICDPAMGSGAFLVQACRYLAERLVEAWGEEEKRGRAVTAEGEVVEVLGDRDPLPTTPDERLILARRLVAERCLYGVDLNPLAVELAKLSLWLVTLSKGRPFGFLDHALRVGDSLLGVERIDELAKFTMEPETKSRPTLFAHVIEEKVHEALRIRRELHGICVVDIEDVETMKALDRRARERLAVLETVADAMIGEALRTGGKKRVLERALDALSSDVAEALRGDAEALERVRNVARNSLAIDLPEGAPPRKPFHWALEFPEVFVEGEGFDAMVGNPPFLGGDKIGKFMGDSYKKYLDQYVAQVKGTGKADFVIFFFLRGCANIREKGTMGFIATNSIAEGDTREFGLYKLKETCKIYNAVTNEVWPGKAAVVTSRIHLIKDVDYNGILILNGKKINLISSFLNNEDDRFPYILYTNLSKSYKGVDVSGDGFFLKGETALELIKKDQNYKDVLFPFLNAENLNHLVGLKTSKWVINFWDWPLDKVKRYTETYKIIEQKVKPEREKKKDQSAKKYWWRFARPRSEMFHAIGRGKYFQKHHKDAVTQENIDFLVVPGVSKYQNFVRLNTDIVISNALIVIALSEFYYYTILQSSIHYVWITKYASRLKRDIRYTSTDVFETFPFPKQISLDVEKVNIENYIVKRLSEIGEKHHKLRKEIMLERNIGLTNLYNFFHNPAIADKDIQKLRQLHIEMDETVKTAYGWSDLDLGHDFHEVPYLPENDRTRFTISEPARLEILKRLLDLNEERHKEEIEASSSDKKGGGKKKKSEGGLF